MPRTHTNNPLATTPVFPGAIHTPAPWLNAPDATDGPYPPVTETFTVPATPDSTGRHRIELDHAITAAADLTVTIGATTLTLVPANLAPSATECAVNLAGAPVLEFHPSHAGATGTATYTPAGTVATADRLNQLEQEIAAAQAAIVAGNMLTVGTGPGAQYETLPAALAAVAAIDRAADEWAIVRILPGAYEGHTSWTQPRCVIVGVGGATLVHESEAETDANPRAQRCTLNVLASDVVVRGLTIDNEADGFPNACIALGVGYGASSGTTLTRVRVEDCRITNTSGRDAVFAGDTGVTMTDCEMTDCYIKGSSDILTALGGWRVQRCTIETDQATPHTTTFLGGTNTFVDVLMLGPVIMFNILDDATVTATNCHAPHPDSTVWVSYGTSGPPKNLTLSACTSGTPQSARADPGNIGITLTTRPFAADVKASTDLHMGVLYGVPDNEQDPPSVARLLAFEDADTVIHAEIGPQDDYKVAYSPDFRLIADAYRGTGDPEDDVLIRDAMLARIEKSTLTAKGSILTATAANTPAELAVPSTAGPWILRPASGAATGLEWIQRGVLYLNTADSAEISSFDAYTAYSLTYAFPVDALAVGSRFRVHASGIHTVSNAGNTWFDVGIVLGTTYLNDLRAATTVAGQSNNPWQVTADFTVRAIGAGGSIKPNNYCLFYRSGVVAQKHTTPVSINLSSSPLTLAIRSRTGRADANDKATLTDLCVERLA